MKHTAKSQQRGKNKGRKALYFSKWYYTTTRTAKRPQRQIRAIKGGKLS